METEIYKKEINLRFTYPCYITLDAKNVQEGDDYIRQVLRHIQVVFGKENDAPPEFVTLMNISYVIGKAVLGEFNPVGRDKDELAR